MGYSPGDCKESDMSERLSAHTHTDPITALHSHLQLTILRNSEWVVSNAYILKAQTFDGDSVVPI